MNIIRETAAHYSMIGKTDKAFWALQILTILAFSHDMFGLGVFYAVASIIVWIAQIYLEKQYEEQVRDN